MARTPAKKASAKRRKTSSAAAKKAAGKRAARKTTAKRISSKAATPVAAASTKAKKTPAKKRASRKSGPAAAPPNHGTPPQHQPGQALIRMYRQGLGDCFLVMLPKADGTHFKMLIDCGVIIGQEDAKNSIRNTVDNVIAATGGVVDVLAVTHEHWDHVSGFIDAADKFCTRDQDATPGKLKVEKLWFAWTENDRDPTARTLQGGLKALLAKTQATAMALDSRHEQFGASPQLDALRRGYREVLSFFGSDAATDTSPFAADGKTSKTRKAMEFAAGLSRDITYLDPRQSVPWTSDDLPGIRIFTLGPPRDPKALRRTEPGKEGFAFDSAMGADILSAMGTAGDQDSARSSAPFSGLPLPRRDAAIDDFGPSHDFIQRHYSSDVIDELPDGGTPQGPVDQDWRRIDTEWINGASEFALALDGQTNNTSLVLAIELSPGGPVLLFVADAQAGNWMSWHDLTWQIGDRHVTARDLLSRTTFLKVGHHGSHNATLDARGLGLMTQPDLVAAVPVDRETARKKGWHEMPLDAIMHDLARRTGDRVVLSEATPPAKATLFQGKGFKPGEIERDQMYFEFRRPMRFA